MKLSELRQDTALETEGVEVELPIGVVVRVARWENPRAEARREKLYMPHRQLLRRGKVPPRAVRDRIDIDIIAHEVLKGWDLVDDDDVAIPCTPERIIKILSDPSYRDLLEEIRDASGEREKFRRDDLKDAEKNSGRPPAGSSSGGRSRKSSEA